MTTVIIRRWMMMMMVIVIIVYNNVNTICFCHCDAIVFLQCSGVIRCAVLLRIL